MTDISDKFFSALLTSGDATDYIRLGNVGEVFTHIPSDAEDYTVVKKFLSAYGKLPDLDTFNELTGKTLKPNNESFGYFYDQLMSRHVKKTMLKCTMAAQSKLDSGDVNAAFSELKAGVDSITLQRLSPKIYDFRESHDILAAELVKKQNPDYGFDLGWPSLDDLTGGCRAGDMISILGLSGQGKTFLALAAALHAWEKQGKIVTFVSMEMNPVLIFERLAATYQHIPHDWVKHGKFSTLKVNRKKQFLDKLKALEDENIPPFYVIDGNMMATVEDVRALCTQMKPDVLVVDGAYMLNTERGQKNWEQVANVCKFLKSQVAEELAIPVLCTWQFTKDVAKFKKHQTPGMEDAGGSYEIAKISSIGLGLLQEESAETSVSRVVKIMKGRSGEKGQFRINWNFQKMDFSEVPPIMDNEVYFANE